MKRFSIILAALATVSTTAAAQEFNGKCTDYNDKGRDACKAIQWCAWREGRTISLPDGQSFTAKGSCAFLPHHKAAWAAKVQSTQPPQQ
jgi:hypothetical protein